MSRMVPLLLLLLSTSLLSPAARADDDDAALMKACPGLAAWAATHPRGNGAPARDDRRHYSDPALRHELAVRAAADETARNASTATDMRDKAANEAVLAVDAGNLSWLKGVVATRGFPAVDDVGGEGISHAWLLVQHADRDPAFQATVLRHWSRGWLPVVCARLT
ncbi:hypothetical protein ACPPVV_02705 [Rhodanobacter sp. Col0626]|uniref:hypothetical protein n=1 Tax=Rhodanobacter sp. Col0626 TaxID=3415679 RepID=UPI003CF49C6C